MEALSETDLDNLPLGDLAGRMDKILASRAIMRRHNDILKLNISSIYRSEKVGEFSENIQRKLIYKVFGLFLQVQYTDEALTAKFADSSADNQAIRQLQVSARNQWVIISSRMAFEYFMHILYLLGTGEELRSSKSAIKKFKKWLMTSSNPYTYFSLTAARAFQFDRMRRSPEIHAGSKMPRKILMLEAENIDNDILKLLVTIKTQWQFVIALANGEPPSGWASNGNTDDDKEWYDIFNSGCQEAINKKIEELFTEGAIEL